MKIAEVSIKRPVFAVMLIGAFVALGLVAWGRLGVDLFPRVEFPFTTVTTTLAGASPDAIETEITDAIEEQVNTISGVKSVRSTSSEGVSQIFVEFGLDQDADVKAQDVRDKVAVATRELPADADPPIVQKVDPDAEPILSIMVAGDASARELTDWADKVLKRRIERVPGVGSATLLGGRKREIRVWLDADKLRAYGVTATDVIDAIRREHAEVPGGRLEAEGGTAELAVKTKGEVARVQDFASIAVAYRANGSATTVGDVARIEDGTEDERSYAELNGRPGVSLEVRRQSGQNTLAVADAVKREVEALRASAPPGFELVIARDVSTFVSASRDDVFKDIYVAIAIVTVVVFAFLTSIRATIIVFVAIPTSLVATFFLFYLGGFTLNMMSMMALQLAVGLLVDDAIVVLEAIYKKLEEGKPPVEAAIEGTQQVGMAVIASTLAVCAVFVPIAFMSGMVGQFFYQYGLAIAFSVLVSLLVSLTLTPMLCARILRHSQNKGAVARALESWHAMVDRNYVTVLRLALKHPVIVTGAAVATMVAGFMVAATIPAAFSSKADRSEFLAQIDLPQGTGLEVARAAGSRVAAEIKRIPHVRTVFFTIGSGADQRVNRVAFYVQTDPKDERRVTQFDIEDQARAAMRRLAPEATNLSVSEVPWISGGGMQAYQIMYSLEGPDLATLQATSEAILAKMRRSGLFADARTSYEPGKPEVQFRVDRDKAADLGVPVRALATTIRATVGGVEAGSFEDGGERYDVRVRLEAGQRDDIDKLGRIQVRASTGRVVDVASVADVAIEEGPAQIDRRNRARAISIQANPASGVPMGEAVAAINRFAAEAGLPDGYRLAPFGQVENMKETGEAIVFAFGLAMLALYMVLASQFNSYGQPAIMMLAAPLSFFGAFLGLKLSGLEMTMFAQIGLIALMGIVLKNGILLVDHANVAREERGLSAYDAMLEAGEVRLRPVLMTALTMIFGMLPAVFSESQGAEFRAPMAVLIVGGMISSTALTLVVVPAIYVLAANGRSRLSRLAGRLRGRRAASPQPAE